jgi:two-component system sensor histidine kinase GlrK
VKRPSHPKNKKFYFGSLYQWVLASFVIVTLPLVFAIIYAVIEVSHYTEKSQQTLFQTVNTTESSRIILERLVSMERSIRQFQVLNEPEIFKSYQEHRKRFADELQSLKNTTQDRKLQQKLKSFEETENNLYQEILIKAADNQNRLTNTDLDAFDSLSMQARELLAEGEKRAAREATHLSLIATQVREKMMFSAFASIPLALLLGLIFVHLLTRPIKSIGLAIRSLGDEGFDQPISVKGPKDLAELGHNLEWLRQKLNRLDHEKQQFIRNISHELKTPLASIKEGTDLLAENIVGKLNTEQQEIIELMKMSNIIINDLVENLLEYQRSISTPVELNIVEIKVHPLIDRIVNEYQLPLKSKNIILTKEINTIMIKADYDKLKIIISNIFSNALKFSPENGTIGITIQSHLDSTQFIIEDQGPGIAINIRHLIFNDFYQGKAPQSWNIKGSGLGLALVRHFLEAHGGQIKLLDSNERFCGARFCVFLPQQNN